MIHNIICDIILNKISPFNYIQIPRLYPQENLEESSMYTYLKVGILNHIT